MKTRKLFVLLVIALMTATSAFAQDNARRIDVLVKNYYDYGQFNGSVLVAEKGKVV